MRGPLRESGVIVPWASTLLDSCPAGEVAAAPDSPPAHQASAAVPSITPSTQARIVTGTTVKAGRTLDRSTITGLVADLDRHLAARPGRVTVDLGAVENFDSSGLGGIVASMRRAADAGVDVKLRGVSQPMLDFFSLVSVQRLLQPARSAARLDPVTRLGGAITPALESCGAVLTTAAATLRAVLVDPFRGRRLRLDRTAAEIDRAANGALPIVVLIAFLLGLILAMQAYVQLRVWGAELYMADMVGVSVISEIGPLMTAIVLAARSGSSNAAQLGAMVVGEEVDALRQMGIHPIGFLVAPKVLALGFATVALGLVFAVVAICGGALFAWAAADIDVQVYVEQTRQALRLGDFLVATCKSLTFGACVGVVGCALGLRVTGGSEGVGRATTNAVVLGIFLIILIDAAFVTVQRLVLA